MNTPFRLIVFASCIAALMSIGAPAAYAVECSAARPSNAHGYCSWRLIDGRKCWYAGKTMISKTLLRWPTAVAAAPVQAKAKPVAMPVSPAVEKRITPLDAQARFVDEDDSFESRWRSRIIHEETDQEGAPGAGDRGRSR
jgi:hypothetical protein